MKNLILSLLLATQLAALPPNKTKPLSVLDRVKLSSVVMTMETQTKGFTCTATIVGSHALLTAKHCTEDIEGQSLQDMLVKIEGHLIKIEKVIRTEGEDAAFILESNLEFPAKYIASLDFNNVHTGDTLLGLGNPVGFRKFLHKGIVMGFGRNNDCYLDMVTAPGDSGMGLFNTKGKLVGLVSGGYYTDSAFQPTYISRILFTPEQIKEAITYGNK